MNKINTKSRILKGLTAIRSGLASSSICRSGLASIRNDVSSSRSGSVLVYALMVLSLVLVITLGISAVAVIERKTSSTTGKSTVAFQAADSCVEIVSQKIYGSSDDDSVASIFGISSGFGSCDTTSGVLSLDSSIVGTGKSCKVTFYDSTDTSTSTHKISCNDASAPLKRIFDVRAMQSIGIYSNTTRAVQTAIAAGGTYRGCLGACAASNSAPNNTKTCSMKDSADINVCTDNNGCTLRFVLAPSNASNMQVRNEIFFQNSSPNNNWVLGYGASPKRGTNGNSSGTNDVIVPFTSITLYDDYTSANCNTTGVDDFCLVNSDETNSVNLYICD